MNSYTGKSSITGSNKASSLRQKAVTKKKRDSINSILSDILRSQHITPKDIRYLLNQEKSKLELEQLIKNLQIKSTDKEKKAKYTLILQMVSKVSIEQDRKKSKSSSTTVILPKIQKVEEKNASKDIESKITNNEIYAIYDQIMITKTDLMPNAKIKTMCQEKIKSNKDREDAISLIDSYIASVGTKKELIESALDSLRQYVNKNPDAERIYTKAYTTLQNNKHDDIANTRTFIAQYAEGQPSNAFLHKAIVDLSKSTINKTAAKAIIYNIINGKGPYRGMYKDPKLTKSGNPRQR